jgi:rSAM/selenodomain-associated transferase 2
VNISIIVPELNEAAIIRGFLEHLRTFASDAEIIVVDGGSNDGSVELCRDLADCVIESVQGRARQMNAGARAAHGEILWFLHADSRIATNSLKAIEDVLADSRIVGGCFRLRIVPARLVYRVRDVIGNLCVNLFRIGLGDRGLFCRKETFLALGGYPDQPLLEDADFYRKLRAVGHVRQIPITIQTSARRYEALGPMRTSLFYLLIMTLYLAGTKMSILEKMVGWFGSRKTRGTDILSVGQAGVAPALTAGWKPARPTAGTAMPQCAPHRGAGTTRRGDIRETISNLNP